MKTNPISFAGALLLAFFSYAAHGQSAGAIASGVWISDCNQSNFFNTSGSAASFPGPIANDFNSSNLGVHTQNSGTLILRGAQLKTFKDPATSNICNARLFYRIYLQSAAPGAFNAIDLPLFDACDISTGQFPSGGSCNPGDQKWQRIVADGTTTPYAPINLTNRPPGNYFLEVYYEASGSLTTTTLCNDIITLNNGGANYKAPFSIQAPTLSSTNPSSCNGTEGSITISGLLAGASYDVSYSDDGATIGPLSLMANGSGQLIVTGLNAGLYSNFALTINGCTTDLFTGLILSNPIFVPTFSAIAPFCAGTAAPTLASTSNNGISGTWSPAVINNTASGTYTFTPAANQCGLPVNLSVNVIQRTVPVFAFGTSLIICNGGSVPALPTTSTNGISGTWSPAVVSNQNSGVYTFTPTAGSCTTTASFSVTVTPNISPVFGFGSTLTICAGQSVPAFPGTSVNGITGAWSPATVDNQNSGTYTFTPTAGLCAIPISFDVTVNPNIVPVFPFGTSMTVCAQAMVPVLPVTSSNGIAGTWSPAVVDPQSSGTYTFTPAAGLCATPASFSLTVTPNIVPTFSFGTSLTICSGGTVPALTAVSTNGIAGTWSPAIVDNLNTGTYTFTPNAGLCATPASFTVTVTPNIVPAFSFGNTLAICAGGSVPALPTTSSNGITGAWSPAVVDAQNSGAYTFTPTPGLCAVTKSFTVTVNPVVAPVFSFGTSMTLCASTSVPTLPATSTNGVTGTWNPATVSNQATGTYTFTPTAGLCATPTTFTLTVTPNIVPSFSFGTNITLCSGSIGPPLPTTSTNGVTGTWAPATIDNLNSGTYVFTPTAGLCALPATLTITINPNITPAFTFGTSMTICDGNTAPVLPTTSTNGITGAWSPAIVDSHNSGTYTFTPTAGLCALPASFAVTVSPNIIPAFAFGSSLTICAGAGVPVLPSTSTNGITGAWTAATVDNQHSATYTFTPMAGLCATPVALPVTVNPNIVPTFSFGTGLAICAGGTVPLLPTTSSNGITGTWSPAIADNQNSATYIFTPTAGLCALPAAFAVTVSPNVTPSFAFGSSLTICAGATVPTLPSASTNGITGTWSPATVDNQHSATYTFTPNAGQCVIPTTLTFTVTVTTNLVSTFSFGPTLAICTGGTVPVLSNTSLNGLNGTWAPAVVSSQAGGIYVFTPTAGQCVVPSTFTVTVNQILDPSFTFGTSQSICIGGNVPVLPALSANGITGTWSPAMIDNSTNAVYAFTPAAGQCANAASFTLQVNQIPTGTIRADTSVYDGATVPAFDFNATSPATVSWTNSNPDIGLPASGTGQVPSFTAVNLGSTPITATITVTPRINGCVGTARTYTITVLPLSKDVFVPNVFTPNGDGKNDILFVYGNYITKVDMRIFNQWGQQIAAISNKTQGWDGRHNGSPQPVGVYVYVLKAELADGRTVSLKGSITLVR